MRNFYVPSAPAPLDQAHGLRRLFAGQRQRFLPLAANPHVAFSGVVLERLTATLVAAGQRVLVVDAADSSPLAHELTEIDLALAVEVLSPQVSYLAGRGLPLAYVDTRGSAGGLLDALALAAPDASVVLLHAEATHLARLFMRRAARPLLIGADQPESIKHAYAACKLLARRCNLMTFDLLLAATPGSRRLPTIAASLASCADGFLGALLHDWAVIDPASDPAEEPPTDLTRLVKAQLALAEDSAAPAWRHATTPPRALSPSPI
jgi:flagellar biosynthesis protein FlhG